MTQTNKTSKYLIKKPVVTSNSTAKGDDKTKTDKTSKPTNAIPKVLIKIPNSKTTSQSNVGIQQKDKKDTIDQRMKAANTKIGVPKIATSADNGEQKTAPSAPKKTTTTKIIAKIPAKTMPSKPNTASGLNDKQNIPIKDKNSKPNPVTSKIGWGSTSTPSGKKIPPISSKSNKPEERSSLPKDEQEDLSKWTTTKTPVKKPIEKQNGKVQSLATPAELPIATQDRLDNRPDSRSNDLYQKQDLLQPSLKPRKREIGSTTTRQPQAPPPIGNQAEQSAAGAITGTVQEMVASNNQLINDCISIIIQCDPDQACSKDELISRIAYQRNLQLKQNGGVKNKTVIAMEKILSDLRNEQMDEGIQKQNQTRVEQDKIVLANEMDPEVHKLKIDMTPPEKDRHKGDDPHCVVVSGGRDWWNKESKRPYQAPTAKVAKEQDLFKQTRGNKELPKEIAKQLIGY